MGTSMWRVSEESQPLQWQQLPQQQQQASVLSFASSHSIRKWPFVAVLLSVVLFLGSSPWLYSQLVPKYYNFQPSNRRPALTVEGMMFNPLEVGRNYTYEEAAIILNCTNRRWMPELKPFSKKSVCPTYFHLIKKDLSPWSSTGITRANVEMGKTQAFARFTIIEGQLYMEQYRDCYGTRSVFTIWGLLLFLEKYKGKVPDVEFMFNCEDRPRMPKWAVGPTGPTFMFSYDTRSDFFDVPFPDWSFWGWSDLSIRSWDEERESIMKGSKRKEWPEKIPKAFWTGNPSVGAPQRKELTKCNHWARTEIHPQNWAKELSSGKHNSNLEDQCTYKYMIYTEGVSWSVSFKYILACGSPVLIVSPAFYDFFSRGLKEQVSYLPVRPPALRHPELCFAIDAEVQVGEANTTRAMEIGKLGQDYMNNDVSMEMVYNYMFHVLLEYAKLQKFKPGISQNSHLLTLDHFQCLTPPRETPFLHRAMEVMPMNSVPCTMPEVPKGQDAFQGYNFEIIQPFRSTGRS